MKKISLERWFVLFLALGAFFLRADTPPFQHFSSKLQPISELTDIVHGSEGFLLLSVEGGVLRSRDLDRWARGTIGIEGFNFRSVAFGNDMYLAVGEPRADNREVSEHVVASSREGLEWETLRIDHKIARVSYLNDGFFYGFDRVGSIFRSNDGMEWVLCYQGQGDAEILEIEKSTETYVAVGAGANNGAGYLLTSIDGKEWVQSMGV